VFVYFSKAPSPALASYDSDVINAAAKRWQTVPAVLTN
jgi:hypothetical protein